MTGAPQTPAVIITDHAQQRLRQRCSVPLRKVQTVADEAWRDGRRAHEVSAFWRHRQTLNPDVLFILHRDIVFVFGLKDSKTHDRPKLVTVHRRDHQGEARF